MQRVVGIPRLRPKEALMGQAGEDVKLPQSFPCFHPVFLPGF